MSNATRIPPIIICNERVNTKITARHIVRKTKMNVYECNSLPIVDSSVLGNKSCRTGRVRICGRL